jgi:hypothetical protein
MLLRPLALGALVIAGFGCGEVHLRQSVQGSPLLREPISAPKLPVPTKIVSLEEEVFYWNSPTGIYAIGFVFGTRHFMIEHGVIDRLQNSFNIFLDSILGRLGQHVNEVQIYLAKDAIGSRIVSASARKDALVPRFSERKRAKLLEVFADRKFLEPDGTDIDPLSPVDTFTRISTEMYRTIGANHFPTWPNFVLFDTKPFRATKALNESIQIFKVQNSLFGLSPFRTTVQLALMTEADRTGVGWFSPITLRSGYDLDVMPQGRPQFIDFLQVQANTTLQLSHRLILKRVPVVSTLQVHVIRAENTVVLQQGSQFSWNAMTNEVILSIHGPARVVEGEEIRVRYEVKE